MRGKNPGIILMPITSAERKGFGDLSVYVLYKNEGSNDIQIGILNPNIRKNQKGLANLYGLKEATEKAYFYNGGAELLSYAELTNRPIYEVHPTDGETVDIYSIINRTENNEVWLEDVLRHGDSILIDQMKTKNQKVDQIKVKVYER